ncbi:MAG: nuclear transport factor 2 family protein [Gammaproteobacteria bacterium]|jgi:hypothetical protein|nr:nuclear transport factor 2 family protein [Gammaproteobacteria bacterium]MBT6664280.1 nuclear transport factor 2 family protein [Gammaproteobacteria bacterium]
MKRLSFLFIALLLLGTELKAADPSIDELLDGFHSAAASSNFDDYFSHFSSNGYFLGTDATERWTVEEFKHYARPAFDAGRGWRYLVQSRNLESVSGLDVVWFDEILTNARLGKCRGTGVIVKENGDWKIAQYSLTLLIPNDIAVSVGMQSMQADALVAPSP